MRGPFTPGVVALGFLLGSLMPQHDVLAQTPVWGPNVYTVGDEGELEVKTTVSVPNATQRYLMIVTNENAGLIQEAEIQIGDGESGEIEMDSLTREVARWLDLESLNDLDVEVEGELGAAISVALYSQSDSPKAPAHPVWGPEVITVADDEETELTLEVSVPDPEWQYGLLVTPGPSGAASVNSGDDEDSDDELEIEIAIEGDEIAELELEPGTGWIVLNLDLTASRLLELEVSGPEGGQAALSVLGPRTESFVGPSGGEVGASGVGSVRFAAGAFVSNREVSFYVTKDTATRIEYDASTLVYAAGPSTAYEVKIGTGDMAPVGGCSVALEVPQWFDPHLVSDYELQAFVQVGDMDEFEPLPSTYDSATRMLSVLVGEEIFSAQRSANGEYEIVIVLGTTPQYWREQ